MRKRCAATHRTSPICAFRSNSSTSPISCATASSRCLPARRRIPNGRVAALRVPQGGTKLSRKEIDDYTTFVARYGAKGLAYVKVNEKAKGRDGLQSPILKIPERCGGQRHPRSARARSRRRSDFLRRRHGEGRERCARCAAPEGRQRPRTVVQAGWRPLWVVDFPMFEWDADDEALGRDASSIHGAARAMIRPRCAPIRRMRCPRATTWC